MTLAELEIGQRARIIQISGDDSVTARMLEMGVTPGCEATMLGVAPLGDPMELEIRNYRLSLRKDEAARVSVEVIE